MGRPTHTPSPPPMSSSPSSRDDERRETIRARPPTRRLDPRAPPEPLKLRCRQENSMPFARIDLVRGISAERRQMIADVVYEAVVEPKKDFYKAVADVLH